MSSLLGPLGIVVFFMIYAAVAYLVVKNGKKGLTIGIFGLVGAGLVGCLMAAIGMLLGSIGWCLFPGAIALVYLFYTWKEAGDKWTWIRWGLTVVMIFSLGATCYLGNRNIPILMNLFWLLLIAVGLYIGGIYGIGWLARGLQILTGQKRQ